MKKLIGQPHIQGWIKSRKITVSVLVHTYTMYRFGVRTYIQTAPLRCAYIHTNCTCMSISASSKALRSRCCSSADRTRVALFSCVCVCVCVCVCAVHEVPKVGPLSHYTHTHVHSKTHNTHTHTHKHTHKHTHTQTLTHTHTNTHTHIHTQYNPSAHTKALYLEGRIRSLQLGLQHLNDVPATLTAAVPITLMHLQ